MSEIQNMQYEYIEQLKAEVSLLNSFFMDIRQLVSYGASEETLGKIDKICVEAIEGESKEASDGT